MIGEMCDMEYLSGKKMVLGCAFLCLLAALTFDGTSKNETTGAAALCLLAVLCLGIVLYRKRQLSTDRLLFLIFIAGCILRLQYVLYTPLDLSSGVRQHDLYSFYSEQGHGGYIMWFYNNGLKLFDGDPTTRAQFYQPPLHHFLAAMWMRLLTVFGMGLERAASAIQFLTLFYSMCCMIVSEQIFRKLGLKKNGLVLATAMIAFHPTFFILAGSVNNDMLSVLFIFLAIYAAVSWYQEPVLWNIIKIALAIGLGMMTKISVALIAPPIACVFLIRFLRSKTQKPDYFRQFCIFGCICVPLGLWYGIRNLVKFDVPITYVLPLEETEAQYIGNYSVWERFFDFSAHPFANVYVNRVPTGADYFEINPVVMLLKSSMFGEYNYGNTVEGITPYCRILLVLNIAVVLLSLCAMVYYLIRKNAYLDWVLKLLFGGYYIFTLFQYMTFCFRYPFTCSMDFRYIVPTVLVGALFVGILAERTQDEAGSDRSIGMRVMNYGVWVLCALFFLFSAVVYLMLGA